MRALPVGLLLLALLRDGRGAHRASFYVVVLGVAAAAVAALSLYGDLVELPGRAPGEAAARVETACAAVGAVLVLLAAAVRGQAPAAETVPALSVSATVGALLLLSPLVAAAAVRTATPLLRRALAR